MTSPVLIRAAGCIVWRYGNKEPQVVLVHRPRLQDWSFPKGKLARAEQSIAAAVREVKEETNLDVQLGPRLPDQHYMVNGRTPKVVSYWIAQAVEPADITHFVPNHEIDKVRWMGLSKARKRLTYPHDKELLDTFARSAYDSSPLLVVRHAQARTRKAWSHDDSDRPLRADGVRQAQRLVPLLSAYGIRRIVSSDSARCVDTVVPYINTTYVKLTLDAAISEDGVDKKRLARRIERSLGSSQRMAICSHRPVLPLIFTELGIEPISLEPGGIVVVHRRDGKIIGVETLDKPGT